MEEFCGFLVDSPVLQDVNLRRPLAVRRLEPQGGSHARLFRDLSDYLEISVLKLQAWVRGNYS